jgi:biotin carboxyl carrier protein
MKLQLDIDGQSIEADFTLSNGQARLVFDGRAYDARVSQPEPGLYTVLLGARVIACHLNPLPTGAMEASANGRRVTLAVRDKKHLRGNTADAGAGGGRAVLTAPMPGKVARVLCAAGEEVAAGQGVLIVEAMKMQNEVQAPRAGRVVEIKVAEGQTVNAGETLALIE